MDNPLGLADTGQVMDTIITSDQPHLKADGCKLFPFHSRMGCGHLQLEKNLGSILVYICPAQGSKSCQGTNANHCASWGSKTVTLTALRQNMIDILATTPKPSKTNA